MNNRTRRLSDTSPDAEQVLVDIDRQMPAWRGAEDLRAFGWAEMTPELPEALQVAFRVIAVLEELDAPYHVGGSYASSIDVIHLDSGIKVDLVVRGDAPFDLEEFARHRAELVQKESERRIYVKTVEDILLRKLLAEL